MFYTDFLVSFVTTKTFPATRRHAFGATFFFFAWFLPCTRFFSAKPVHLLFHAIKAAAKGCQNTTLFHLKPPWYILCSKGKMRYKSAFRTALYLSISRTGRYASFACLRPERPMSSSLLTKVQSAHSCAQNSLLITL